MKVFLMAMSLSLPLCLSAQSSAWAGDEKPGDRLQSPEMEQRRLSVMEELMSMLKDTMGILSNLDGKPTNDERKRLDAMISRLDVLLAQQQDMIERTIEEQKEFMRRQNETFPSPQRQDDILPHR